MNDRTKAKKAVGRAAAELVEDEMDLGLGTGSTTAFAIEALGKRIEEDDLRVRGIATSFQAELLARKAGIPLTTFDEVQTLDMAIDGADEFDEDLNLIKGGGGAHSREKIVASQAARFVVLVDESKRVDRLGEKMPVPLEVLPMAVPTVRRSLQQWGMDSEVRQAEKKSGPVVTDQGFWIVDVTCEAEGDIAQIFERANNLPGVLDHGLFIEMTSEVLLGLPDGSVQSYRRSDQ